MSRHADLITEVVKAWNAGDLDAALAKADPNMELDWSASVGPLQGVYHGVDGARRLFKTFRDAWESVRWEVKEVTALGDDEILVVTHVTALGRDSGAGVEAGGAQIWTLRDGRILRIELYQSKEAALDSDRGRPLGT